MRESEERGKERERERERERAGLKHCCQFAKKEKKETELR